MEDERPAVDTSDDALLKQLKACADGALPDDEAAVRSDDEPVPAHLFSLLRQVPSHRVAGDVPSDANDLSLANRADQPITWLRSPLGFSKTVLGSVALVSLCFGAFIAYVWTSERMNTLEAEKVALVEEAAGLKTALDATSSELRRALDAAASSGTEVQQLREQLSAAEQARDFAAGKLMEVNQELDHLTMSETAREKEIGRLRLFLKTLSSYANDQQVGVQEAAVKTDVLVAKMRETERLLSSLENERAQLKQTLDRAEQHVLETESWIGRLMTSYVRSEAEKKQIAEQLVTSKAEGRRLSQAFTRLREQAWVDQVARYYSLYGGQAMQRHLVEVSADEHDHIKSWLGDQMGSPISIPDLSDEGLVFVGARLLDVQGAPAGQLTYLDESSRPVVVCLLRGSTERDGFAEHEQGDIRLVEWQGQRFRYVVVGEESRQRLTELAHFVRDTAPSI